MIVVADTSPINYLVQIQYENLLPRLYGQVILPVSVVEELRHAGAPAEVRAWASELPHWVRVLKANGPPDPQLESLGPGEREAIQICGEVVADLLLIDDRKGRIAAHRRGFSTTGTLGVILSAAELGWVDPGAAYRKLLSTTSFRVSRDMETQFIQQIRRSS